MREIIALCGKAHKSKNRPAATSIIEVPQGVCKAVLYGKDMASGAGQVVSEVSCLSAIHTPTRATLRMSLRMRAHRLRCTDGEDRGLGTFEQLSQQGGA